MCIKSLTCCFKWVLQFHHLICPLQCSYIPNLLVHILHFVASSILLQSLGNANTHIAFAVFIMIGCKQMQIHTAHKTQWRSPGALVRSVWRSIGCKTIKNMQLQSNHYHHHLQWRQWRSLRITLTHNKYSNGSRNFGEWGPRNIIYKSLHLVAIFFMTIFYRPGGGGAWPPCSHSLDPLLEYGSLINKQINHPVESITIYFH